MSGEMRQLHFAATTHDVQHWTPEHRAAAEAAGGYHDWVFDQLAEAMRAAGQAFIAAHPDLFAVDDLT